MRCFSDKNDFVTVIVKVVDFCNYECSFCRYFLDNERVKSIMSIDVFKQIIIKASKYNLNHGLHHLTVIFHGGEPLLWGLDNFKAAIQFQKEYSEQNESFKFINDIQTNGSLINQEWAKFFQENNFSIGISIDGPDAINFHRNSTLSNEVVLKNIKYLQALKCKFGILSVITDKHRGEADTYYNFLIENDIHSVGLCYCFDSNEHGIVSNEVLMDFLVELFDKFFYGDYELHVREFEFVMKLCYKIKIEGCTYSFGRSCSNYFTVFPLGEIHFCDSYDLDDEPLGNINLNDFEDIKRSSRLSEILQRANDIRSKTCSYCNIENICGGGCSRHIVSSGSNAFCETFKVLYPHIKYVIEKESEVRK